jgi:hypothetical protein
MRPPSAFSSAQLTLDRNEPPMKVGDPTFFLPDIARFCLDQLEQSADMFEDAPLKMSPDTVG